MVSSEPLKKVSVRSLSSALMKMAAVSEWFSVIVDFFSAFEFSSQGLSPVLEFRMKHSVRQDRQPQTSGFQGWIFFPV